LICLGGEKKVRVSFLFVFHMRREVRHRSAQINFEVLLFLLGRSSTSLHCHLTLTDKTRGTEESNPTQQRKKIATEHHVHTHRERESEKQTDRGETKHISMMNVTSQCFLDTR
jgi:hypothetical protein